MKINQTLRNNPEFTQSLFRLAIWLTISVLIWIQFAGELDNLHIKNYLIFMISFLLISIAVLISILLIPQSVIRPYLTPFCDLGSVCYTMVLTASGPFSAYYLLFPWIFVGYGTRYGRGPLAIATIVALIGYLYVLWLFDSWQTELFSSVLYTLFLIILPLYVFKMTSKLKDSQQAAIKANNIKSEFLATMSHEIRTPMSGIIGMISLLENTKLEQLQKEYVVALQQSSSALHALINDILDVSKLEAGKYHLQNTQFDLGEVILGVVKLFSPLANEKSIELISYIQPEIPKIVEGDPNKLRQIILNLVSNAIKFTDEGEVNIITSIVANKADELVRIKIEVRDTGLGIPNKQLEKIFQPFYQAKNISASKHSGTGLGTTISHQLATLMNGEIAACSDEHKGSVFWVELPYYVAEYQYDDSNLSQITACDVIVLDDIKSSAQATENYLKFLKLDPIIITKESDVINYLSTYSAKNKATVIISESHKSPNRDELAKQLKEHYSAKTNLILITNIENITKLNNKNRKLYHHYIVRPIAINVLKNIFLSLYSNNKPISADNINNTQKSFHNGVYSILIAEDSDINAKVICTFLEQDGYKTTRVISGQAALQELIKNKYDLVLMDMRMSDIDGLQATVKWRQQQLDTDIIQSAIDIPIIALTANATVEDKQRCINAGMNKFLSKPVSKENLISTINDFIMCK
ncbi:hypothetical protein MNBD_GAMMA22-943 [hydrothermal vent metagenome]|uniref:histidine kinase n=1 Tax=hydrothermal vent metagenome TaxID=652676 RepID=A0A3B1ALM2_9ZZZZ